MKVRNRKRNVFLSSCLNNRIEIGKGVLDWEAVLKKIIIFFYLSLFEKLKNN